MTATAGGRIVAVSWAGTALFAVTALLAASGVEHVGYANVVLSLALFAASVPVSLFALARAAVRAARESERITVSGLFFLSRSAPTPVRLALLGSFAAALVIAGVSASAEPFGILVPVYQLSLCGLWGAWYGTFPRVPGGSA